MNSMPARPAKELFTPMLVLGMFAGAILGLVPPVILFASPLAQYGGDLATLLQDDFAIFTMVFSAAAFIGLMVGVFQSLGVGLTLAVQEKFLNARHASQQAVGAGLGSAVVSLVTGALVMLVLFRGAADFTTHVLLQSAFTAVCFCVSYGIAWFAAWRVSRKHSSN